MKVNFNIFIIGLLALSMFLAACGPVAPATAAVVETEPVTTASKSSLKVLASTTFLADIAQNVAGDRAVVESLLSVGADPHSYQAAPSDVAKIAESQVLILNGVEYEHFIEPLLENAGGERLVIEVANGLEVLQMAEHEGEDHLPEAHVREVCEQLEGKTAEEEIQSGAEAAAAVELHDEAEHAEGEQAHEREIVTLKLNTQADGTFAGYLLFDSEEEQDYAFTAPTGNLSIMDTAGMALEAAQTLTIDCSGMSVGAVYKLPVGEYVVALTGFSSESISFSAAPMHAHEAEGEEHEGHTHEAGDPHMWLDPTRVVTYVENIRAGLSEVDPEGAETYKANAETYVAKLYALDKWIAEQVNSIPAERRLLVTNHEALGYFAARYEFKVVGAVIPSLSTEASPSAQQMAELVEQIRAAKAPAIFLGEVENPSLAKQVAEETGVKVVEGLYLETLTDGAPAATYIDMMKYNVNAIVEALK